MSEFTMHESGFDLVSLADAFEHYQTTMSGADREVRKRLSYSVLEGAWSEVLAIFASGDPEARELLLLIVDRVPEDRLFEDVGQLLIQTWLRSSDGSVLDWLRDTAESNTKLRSALGGVDLGAPA